MITIGPVMQIYRLNSTIYGGEMTFRAEPLHSPYPSPTELSMVLTAIST